MSFCHTTYVSRSGKFLIRQNPSSKERFTGAADITAIPKLGLEDTYVALTVSKLRRLPKTLRFGIRIRGGARDDGWWSDFRLDHRLLVFFSDQTCDVRSRHLLGLDAPISGKSVDAEQLCPIDWAVLRGDEVEDISSDW